MANEKQQINLKDIRPSTIFNHKIFEDDLKVNSDYLLSNTNSFTTGDHTRFGIMTKELAKVSKPDLSETLNHIYDTKIKLAEIPYIVPDQDDFDELNKISGFLEKINIKITPEQLRQDLDVDAISRWEIHNWREDSHSLINLLSKLQQEVFFTKYASRSASETKQLFLYINPNFPCPTQNCNFAISTNSDAGCELQPDGHYVVSIPFAKMPGDKLIQNVNQDGLISITPDNPTIIFIAHETGHVVLNYLLPPNEAENILKRSRWKNTAFSLVSEGYAIINELFASDVAIACTQNETDIDKIKAVKVDRFNSMKKEYDEGRFMYVHGYQLMRRLIWQLGSYQKRRDEQIIDVYEFLKTVDFEKASLINPDDPAYTEILHNPLEKLPKKQ